MHPDRIVAQPELTDLGIPGGRARVAWRFRHNMGKARAARPGHRRGILRPADDERSSAHGGPGGNGHQVRCPAGRRRAPRDDGGTRRGHRVRPPARLLRAVPRPPGVVGSGEHHHGWLPGRRPGADLRADLVAVLGLRSGWSWSVAWSPCPPTSSRTGTSRRSSLTVAGEAGPAAGGCSPSRRSARSGDRGVPGGRPPGLTLSVPRARLPVCGDHSRAGRGAVAVRRRGPADHAARPGLSRRGRPPRRGAGHAAPGRRGPAGHDQRAGPVARAGRVRPARPGAAAADRAGLLASGPAGRVRVLVTRGVRAADRGVAVVRVPPPAAARPRPALAPESRADLRRGAGPAARGGPAQQHPAGRGQGRRPVVGLVGHEDRRRVAAGRGRGRLRPPGRLAPGL